MLTSMSKFHMFTKVGIGTNLCIAVGFWWMVRKF